LAGILTLQKKEARNIQGGEKFTNAPDFQDSYRIMDSTPNPARKRSQHRTPEPHQWLERYGDQLYNFALSRLRNHEFAEEALQEALMAAVANIDQFNAKSSERTWLFSIMRRKVTDVIRREWKGRSRISLTDEADPSLLLFNDKGQWKSRSFKPTDCPLENLELWQIVQKCLSRLPSSQADVFVLSVLEEKKSQEVCKELEISPSNFAVRMHRARLGLARCVAEQLA
jgi:RNA polymerase sigma-70 factor (TIGR02943 family)